MKYIIEITGPNGNGLYEPVLDVEKHEWKFKNIEHWLQIRNSLPAYLLEDLINECNNKFAYNYKISIEPDTK